MKRYKWIFLPLFLLLGNLSCTPFIQDGSPRLDGTISVERSTKVSQSVAAEIIKTYTQEVLGLDLEGFRASGRSGEINLPVSIKEDVDIALELAGTTYFGVWKDGMASLSIGESNSSGDMYADVKGGSLGTFFVRANRPFPTDAENALSIVLSTFPELSGIDFVEIPNVDDELRWFEFVSKQTDDIHIQEWDVNITGTIYRVGVSTGARQGRSFVWAVVGSGDLAAPLNQP